jgi:phage shock protein C
MAIRDKSKRRIYRSRRNRIIAGVVGGIAEYFGVAPTVLRVIWVVTSLLMPPMLLLDVVIYTALVIIIPAEPPDL